MIKAVIFDLGGVIVDAQPIFAQVVEVFQPEDEEKFWEEINSEGIPLCRGEISLLQFWKEIALKAGKDIPADVLRDLWLKDVETLATINHEVQDIIHALQKNYKLAILSNSIEEHARFNENLGIYSPFDVVILSHEVGLTKHEKDIFFLTAEKLGVSPDECVFVDDIPHFVDVAHSAGMLAVTFENAAQLREDLRRAGVCV